MSASAWPRIVFRNVAAWPEVAKADAFPDDPNPACFSCRAFYTSSKRVFLVPTADLLVHCSPFPDSPGTRLMKEPVIKIPVVKYVSLVRGERSCQKHGYLPKQVAHWFPV